MQNLHHGHSRQAKAVLCLRNSLKHNFEPWTSNEDGLRMETGMRFAVPKPGCTLAGSGLAREGAYCGVLLWDSMWDHRTSLGVPNDNFRFYFWFHVNSTGSPERCSSNTGKESWKKSVGVFFIIFRSNTWKWKGKLTVYKQLAACRLHFGKSHGVLHLRYFSCADFCSHRRQRCFQSLTETCEQQGWGAWPQQLSRFFWAWEGSWEWWQHAAEGLFS